MAELADALDSGSNGRKAVQVQVLLPAPNAHNPNRSTIFMVGESFGFCVCFDYTNFNFKRKKPAPGLPCQELCVEIFPKLEKNSM